MLTESILRVQEPHSNLLTTDEIEKVFDDVSGDLDWRVALARCGPELQLTIYSDLLYYSDETKGPIWLHVVSFKGVQLLSNMLIDEHGFCVPHPFIATIPASEVEQDNEYRFCVVVSSRPDILELFPWQNVTTTPPIVETVEPEPAPFDNDIMMTLLKDTYSVETQFLFTADNSLADVGLWAHRSILSRYQVFRDLIEQASAAQSSSADGGSEFSPLTLTVDKVSLATFCVVLMFIYSGKIERTVDPNKFAISKPQTSLTVHDTAGRVKDMFCWHPLDSDSPWSLKPVTWSELLIAADIYMIEALHARCQEKVIEAIDESSVVETLFRVGSHSPGVKIAAINFIAKNMGTLLTNGKDPFLEFAEDKSCHDMMVEVMRARVKEL